MLLLDGETGSEEDRYVQYPAHRSKRQLAIALVPSGHFPIFSNGASGMAGHGWAWLAVSPSSPTTFAELDPVANFSRAWAMAASHH